MAPEDLWEACTVRDLPLLGAWPWVEEPRRPHAHAKPELEPLVAMEPGRTAHPALLEYLDQRRSAAEADESPAPDQDGNAPLSAEREVIPGEA